MTDSVHSVSTWIIGLKAGEAEAAQRLWDRYAMRLVEIARRKLSDVPKRVADEEDVAQCVFHSLCRGAAAGRFTDVRNRDDLWWLLLAITKQKAVDHMRRETAQKRGSGQVQNETTLAAAAGNGRGYSFDELIGDEPTPDCLVMMEEENQRLLTLLRDDRLRSIAVSRVQGYSVAEIAEDLAVSTRSVERKLNLIRNAWTEELNRGW